MSPLTVLLLESRPDGAAVEAERLAAAGHRVARCHEHRPAGPDSASAGSDPDAWTPCTALTHGTCPLDSWVDVALLAHDVPGSRHEPANGLGCAVRAGVPVVEQVDAEGDPDPWIDRQATRDRVVDACEVAAVESYAPIVERLRETAAPLLEPLGVDPADVDATFEVDGAIADGAVVIRITGPELPGRVAEALSERAIAALRDSGRRMRTADAGYQPRA
ncbi:MAG: hypothetical protein GXY13_04910 [Acidimicrobiales bacterium]|nr:hypothetical protein [Acidimicrobiales bacterium]